MITEALTRRLIESFEHHLGKSLIALVLFGSQARGEANSDSDIDLLLIANPLPERRLERRTFVRQVLPADHAGKISIFAKTPGEFEHGFPTIYLDLGMDGKCLYDRNDYMKGKLRRIREIIRQAGLYRVKEKDGYMWHWHKQPSPNWSVNWDGFHDSPR